MLELEENSKLLQELKRKLEQIGDSLNVVKLKDDLAVLESKTMEQKQK